MKKKEERKRRKRWTVWFTILSFHTESIVLAHNFHYHRISSSSPTVFPTHFSSTSCHAKCPLHFKKKDSITICAIYAFHCTLLFIARATNIRDKEQRCKPCNLETGEIIRNIWNYHPRSMRNVNIPIEKLTKKFIPKW